MINEIAVEVKLNDEDAKKRAKELDRILKDLEKNKIKLSAEVDKLPQLQAQLQKLKKERDELNRQKIKIEADMLDMRLLSANLDLIKSKIQALQNEKIRIQTEMKIVDDLNANKLSIEKQIQALKEARTQIRDALDKGTISGDDDIEEARNKIRSIGIEIEKLSNKKNEINLQIKDVKTLQSRIKEIDAEMKKLNAQKAEIEVKIRDGEKAKKDLDAIDKKAEKIDNKTVDLEAKIEGGEKAKNELNLLEKEAKDLNNEKILLHAKIQDYDKVKSQIANLKTAMGSLGKDLSSFGKGMRTFLGNNSKNPIGKFATFLTQGVAYGSMYRLTSNAMNMVSDSFSAGINRFDTINAGTRTLKALGFEGNTVDKSLETLQNNILGLPTTLDQAIGEVTKISAVTNDLPYAVRAYDALNNSILAFGGDAEKSKRAINQVSQSLGKGLIDAQTYNSLLDNNMTPALKMVAGMFGYSGEELGKFKSALGEGEISAKQFLDALIKVNEEGVNGEESMKSIAKGNALLSINAGMEVARGRIAAGLQSAITDINEALSSLGYGTIPEILSNIGDFGKEKIISIGTWVKENKDKVADGLDFIGEKIEWFKNELSELDVKSFGTGLMDVAGGITSVVIPAFKGLYEVTKGFATFVGGGDTSKGYGRLLAGYFATSYGLQFFGRGLSGIFSFVDKANKYKKGFGKDGLMGLLGSLFGNGGGNAKDIGNAGQSITSISNAVSGLDRLKNSLGNFDVGGFLNKASNLALFAGVAADIILFAEAVKQINEKVPAPEEMEQFGLKCMLLAGAATGFSILFGVGSSVINAAGAKEFGAGLLVILGISADIIAFAEAVKQIDEKVPTDFGGITAKLGVMGEVFVAFGTVAGLLGTAMWAIGPVAGTIAAVGIGTLIGLAASIVIITEQFSAIAHNLKKIDTEIPDIDSGAFREKVGAMFECLDVVGSSADEILGRGIASLFDASYYADLERMTSDIAKIMNSLKKVSDVDFNGEVVVARMQSMKSVMNEIKGISMPTLQITPQTAENLANTLQNLSKMATECKKLNDVDLDFDSAKISNAVTRLSIVADAFKDVTFPEGKANFQAEDAENLLRSFQALSQVVEPMNKFAESMNDFQAYDVRNKVERMSKFIGLINEEWIGYNFRNFVDAKDVENCATGFTHFVNLAKQISNFSKEMEAYNDIQGNTLLNGIRNFFKDFNGEGNTEQGAVYTLIQDFAKQSSNFSTANTAFTNLKNIITHLQDLSAMTVDQGKLQALTTQVTEFFKLFTGDDAIKIEFDEKAAESIKSAEDATDNLYALITDLASISSTNINWESLGKGDSGLINQVNLFLQDIASLNAGDAKTAISNVQSVLDQLNQMLTTMQGMSDQFTETGKNWGLALWEGFEGVDLKGKMLDYVNTIIQRLNSESARFRTIGSNWGKALDTGFREAVSNTGGNVAAKVASGLEGASSSISAAGSSLGGAFASAFNTAAANINVPNAPGEAAAQGPNKDGSAGYTVKVKEHKAKGGVIGWRPSGTDTVPAMLTPGEFVIKKRAVDHTGLRILDRINQMDLKGAYHAMQARFGESNSITNNQYITNNYTTNDNRKVEINESHSRRSQQIRANRFLRSMR